MEPSGLVVQTRYIKRCYGLRKKIAVCPKVRFSCEKCSGDDPFASGADLTARGHGSHIEEVCCRINFSWLCLDCN